ncbi:flagellar assembly protein A [Clostridium estertheticum]|uniref:flagellar assembly protein A n=1 Tax=Clostridium estertheticum TaxID=238834 RepID=UPI001CF26E95|nr:flagellar assembly protein A [Clostridium estertheticum]MCB2340729.1 FapA family protein [Clostridium estertheticum]
MDDRPELQKFQGASVKECLKNASLSLGVSKELIRYSILEEKRGLFKKHVIISIDSIDGPQDEGSLKLDFAQKDDIKTDAHNEKDGTIEIKNGIIIVKNPCDGGKPAVISNTNANITLTVNGEKVTHRANVKKEDVIEVFLKEDEASRHLNLSTSPDNMEAYISIKYKPKVIYKLKDSEPKNSVLIESEVKEKIMPPKFTEAEINNELLNNKIKYGTLKMVVVKCSKEDEVSQMIIAKGKNVIDAIDDRIEVKYDGGHKDYNNDEVIDYKAIGTVEGVEKGQVLAVLHRGKSGEDGIDINGKVLKCKNSKTLTLGVGEGCELTDEFTVTANSKGRPSLRGSTFFVYKTYEVNGDVELKTGNIQFVGDIVISGSVREGMKVESGNSILIKNNVAEAEIKASGDVVIKGNVIHSNISSGKEDVLNLEFLNDIKSMKDDMLKLIASVRQVKGINLIRKNSSDGELIKILLESKFKKLPQTAIKVVKRIIELENDEDELVLIIKHKILNLAPLNIVDFEELNDVVTIIENKIEKMEMNLKLPVDVVLDYSQDSTIKSSGNIIFTGKGEYVSELVASGSILFQQDKGLARGGVIKAGKEIKCKVVGGLGGVSTKLIVEKNGHIWADVAYPNTRFIIGEREYVLDVLSKNVHAFIDKDRELIVEKLQG